MGFLLKSLPAKIPIFVDMFQAFLAESLFKRHFSREHILLLTACSHFSLYFPFVAREKDRHSSDTSTIRKESFIPHSEGERRVQLHLCVG